ncbi:MAG: cysteine desulfurase [Thermoprotei archaeon]|nr:MAG: cysteine desulfurase [Thermoprotei archaeon]
MRRLDPYEIREDFPLLKRKIRGGPLVYFDNAATTLKPRQVIEAIVDFYKNHYSNVFRGVHTLSQEATSMYEEAREAVAKFIGARDAREVIFTFNATDSINAIAYGWGLYNVKEGDEIVITIMEHHSNILPWMRLAELKKAKLLYADIKEDGTLNYDQLLSMINEKTRIVAITQMSNVLGTINELSAIVKKAHEVGAIVVVDGAQSVPHMKVDVRALDADFLAFSGHKMLAPTGIGVLWGKTELLEEMQPFRLGGGAIKEVELHSVVYEDLPLRFEAGTPNIVGAIGLKEAIEYLNKIGMDEIRRHEIELVNLTFRLFEEELADKVEVYGPLDPNIRGGIISYNIKGYDPHLVGVLLDSFGITVRTGKHCAHPLHRRLGVNGTVRASYYIYNTKEEVEYMVNVLKEFLKTVK